MPAGEASRIVSKDMLSTSRSPAWILLPITACLMCSVNAFLVPGPGKLGNSTKVSNDTYACDLKQGRAGDGKVVMLKVTSCWDSTWNKMSCGVSSDPKYFKLTKGENVSIIGKDSRYSTKGIARYFGKDTCVSYVYIKADTLSRVEAAECRTECFEQKLSPRVKFYSHSLRGSYHATHWAFEVTKYTGSSISHQLQGVFMLTILFATLKPLF